MASPPQATDARSASAALSQAEFEQVLREATASIRHHGFGPRSVPVPILRRAIGARATREEFDQALRRLREAGSIALEPHAHPEYLSFSQVQDALPEGQSLLYVLRWLK
jgi:hypothetical protein